MPIVTIEHEEYPSVIVIEYNSLYKNELVNFIHNIKIKDNKEEVYTEPYFFKIMQTNNKNQIKSSMNCANFLYLVLLLVVFFIYIN